MTKWIDKGRSYVTARLLRREDEMIVENHLATTPAEMKELAKQGIPVSGDSVGLMYDDGVKDNPSLSLSERRGVELADLWNAQKNARNKLKDLNNHVPANE